MTTLPYFNLYVGDEAAETSHLTAEEHGAYHRLRCHYWRHDGLPDDIERLCRITGISADRWPAIEAVIRPLFGEGWSLPKLDQHREESEKAQQERSTAGKKAARARWGDRPNDNKRNATAYANAMPDALPNAMPSQSDRNAHQRQLKNSAYEGKEHTRAREPIPEARTRHEAGQWLDNHGVDPLNPKAEVCANMMMAGRLTWAMVEEAAAA